MFWAVWAWLGTVALMTSYAALSRRVDPRLTAPPAVVMWFVFAYYSLVVEWRGATANVADSYVPLAVLGALAGLFMLLLSAGAFLGRLSPPEATRYGPSSMKRDPWPDAGPGVAFRDGSENADVGDQPADRPLGGGSRAYGGSRAGKGRP